MAQPPRVIVADFISDDLAPERAVLQGVAAVEALEAADERELVQRAPDAAAIMLWHIVRLTPWGLARLPQCKLVVRMGVGLDNIDVRAAEQAGIGVANVPDYGTEDVADSALGMMLALARGVHQLNSLCRADAAPWTYTPVQPLHRLRGRTLALLGMSRIGTAVALRARALGMDVVFHDPFVPSGVEKAIGVRRAETLDELLAQAHVLSLHCLLTEQTRHVINARSLDRMPAGAILINTARGGLVDADAVLAAIESGRLAGAGLDVLEKEPPAGDEALLRAWRDPRHPAHHRVLINPHAAFYSEEGIHELRTKAADACRRAVLGQPVRNLVNHPAAR